MEKTIIILLFALITSSYSLVSIDTINNKYTIDGTFSYMEVLERINHQSRRSITGSSDGLSIVREWRIFNKSYNQTIEHLRLNASTDGFNVSIQNGYVHLFPIDTSGVSPDTVYITEEEDTIYRYYSNYSGLYYETTSGVEYANFPLLDSINEINDSISTTFKRVTVEIIGYTDRFVTDNGLSVSDPLLSVGFTDQVLTSNISQSLFFESPISLPSFQLHLENTDSKYNFIRTMEFYIPIDSVVTLRFGSEERREQSVTQSNGIVSTSYESIYNGLSLTIKDSVYTAGYRIDNVELSLIGLTGETVSASSMITEETSTKIFPFKRFPSPRRTILNNTNFNLSMIIHTE